jgi:hypothetical protein
VFVVAVLFIRYRNLSLPTPMASTSDSRRVENNSVMYERVAEFLSTTELSLYQALKQSLHNQATLSFKVHISELATLARSKDLHSSQRSKNTAHNSHFDFLICRSDTLEPLCAVEIKRRGLTRARGLAEKNFKVQVCAAIDLPLVFVDEKNKYLAAELRGDIAGFLPKAEAAPAEKPTASARPPAAAAQKPKPEKATRAHSQPVKPPRATEAALTKPTSKTAQVARTESVSIKPKSPTRPTAKASTSAAIQARKRQAPASKPPATPSAVDHRCPRCQSPTIVRTAKKGAQAGKRFRVCTNFPNCRTVSPA